MWRTWWPVQAATVFNQSVFLFIFVYVGFFEFYFIGNFFPVGKSTSAGHNTLLASQMRCVEGVDVIHSGETTIRASEVFGVHPPQISSEMRGGRVDVIDSKETTTSCT
jgi:hypothetical protein